MSIIVYAYGQSIPEEVKNSRFLGRKNQLDALIQFAYVLVDVYVATDGFMQQVLELT